MNKKNKSPKKLTSNEKELILNFYDDKIWEIDREVGHLIHILSEHLDLEKTLVVFTSDHGEAFGERGAYGHCANNNLNLHRELLHIPMIFWSENEYILSRFYEITQGKTISKLFSLIDLNPTLLDILEIPAPNTFLGRSILTDGIEYVVSQGVVAPDPNIEKYVKTNKRGHAITTDSYKLIWWEQQGYTELYALSVDPSEQQNIANENPDLVRELKKLLLREISQSSAQQEGKLKLKKAIKSLKLRAKSKQTSLKLSSQHLN